MRPQPEIGLDVVPGFPQVVALRRRIDQAGDHCHLPVGEDDVLFVARMWVSRGVLALQVRVGPA